MEQCAVVGGDMVCIGIKGHKGPCQVMTRENFDAAMKAAEIDFMYGSISGLMDAQAPKQTKLEAYVRELRIPVPSSPMDRNKLTAITRSTGKQNLNKLLIEAYVQGLVKP